MEYGENFDYKTLSPDALVSLFADKYRRNRAIIALIGALNGNDLRRVHLSEAAFDALVKGLKHSSPEVRWWCLQLFDHVGDSRCVPHILPLLEDPVPRVARHARHALECEICKPNPETAADIQNALAARKN